MRVIVAALATALVVAVALLVLAAFNLHVFVEAHRDELVARGEKALGRAVTIGAVTPSWLPVGIRFAGVAVADDPGFGAAPFLTAGAVRVVLRPGPLALGRIEVSHVVLDGPRIILVRNAAGRWNTASLGHEPAVDGAHGGTAEGRRRARLSPVWLGFAATEIRDGVVTIEDHGGTTPRRLAANRVRVRVSELRLDGDARVRVDAALSGADVRPDLHLDVSLAHLGVQDGGATPFVARLEVDDLDLAALALAAGRAEPWTGKMDRLVANASGTLDRCTVDVTARSGGGWRIGRHLPLPRVEARVDASAEVTREGVRLTQATGAFGSLAWRATGGASLRPWRLAATLESVPETDVALPGGASPPFRLTEVVVPVRADDALHLGPARARIDDVVIDAAADLTSVEPLVAAGRLHADGFSGLVDATFDADSTTSARVRGEAVGLDVAALARRWRTAVITGRADVSGIASIPWDTADPLRALVASGTVHLRDGSIATMNVVEAVLHRMPAVRLLPQLVTAGTRARFADVFAVPHTGLRTAAIPFDVGGGVLTTPHVQLSAASYDIVGEGTVDAARALRFHGDLILSPELSTTLHGDLPALRYLARPDGRLVVPFRVRGPLDNPTAEPDLKRVRRRHVETRRGGPERATSPDAGYLPPRAVPDDERAIEELQHMLHP